jgi:hypothetical protein
VPLAERAVAVPQLKPGCAYQAVWHCVEEALQAAHEALWSGAQETLLQLI